MNTPIVTKTAARKSCRVRLELGDGKRILDRIARKSGLTRSATVQRLLADHVRLAKAAGVLA